MELNPEQKSKLPSVRDEPKNFQLHDTMHCGLTDYIQPIEYRHASVHLG